MLAISLLLFFFLFCLQKENTPSSCRALILGVAVSETERSSAKRYFLFQVASGFGICFFS